MKFLPVAIVMLTFQTFVLAAPRDIQAPVKIDADRLSHDEQRLITTFSGSVVLSKGGLLLKGDQLELQQLPNGEIKSLMIGKPAQFRQRKTDSEEWIEGEGLEIHYDGQTQEVLIIGQATLRRLKRESLLDQVSGDRLRYNNLIETYQVETQAGMPRARMTLMPRPEGSSP